MYQIDITVGANGIADITITMEFGPQGHHFNDFLAVSGGIQADLDILEGIGVSLGNVRFAGDTVSVSVGNITKIYTRDQLETELVKDITHFDPGNPIIAEVALSVAEAIGSGMDAIESFETLIPEGETSPVFGLFSDILAQRFTAHFIRDNDLGVLGANFDAITAPDSDTLTWLIDDGSAVSYIITYVRGPDARGGSA